MFHQEKDTRAQEIFSTRRLLKRAFSQTVPIPPAAGHFEKNC
jgi:hypothetical protein